MLTDENIQVLRLIAYGGLKTDARISALTALYRAGLDLTEVQRTLNEIASSEITSETNRVKAIALLDKVNDDLNNDMKDLTESEVEKVKDELMKRYM